MFRADKEGRTPAELALKWLYNQPEVTCVLSGMNSMEMVEQNLKTASESHVGCLTASDAALIEQVKEEIKKHVKVSCTGCGYCMPCPRGVDISGTFRCYNAMYTERLFTVYGIPERHRKRIPVCRLRKMRKTLPAAY